MASSAMTFKSRDAHKASKELEEARKAGTAPAELDEDGKEINPHIPDYMRNAPWYLNASEHSGLKHQKSSLKEIAFSKNWYQRGAKVGPKVTKYRKGACTNCGAMSHKTKDCVDRPRKIGAKYTGKNFHDDELIEELVIDFDGKRDQWNGYDPSMHSETIKRFEAMQDQREQLRQDKVEDSYHKGDGGKAALKTGDEDSDDDEDKEAEGKMTNVGTKLSTGHQRGSKGAVMSVRNLRIREDTAKYLINLDPGSAFYDPKTVRPSRRGCAVATR
jgi:pre-mRNA-processing factor SLU7